MLNIFKRRRRARLAAVDNSLSIRSLLDDPSLRALVIGEESDVFVPPASSVWFQLVASGPIRFEPIACVGFDGDVAA